MARPAAIVAATVLLVILGCGNEPATAKRGLPKANRPSGVVLGAK